MTPFARMNSTSVLIVLYRIEILFFTLLNDQRLEF